MPDPADLSDAATLRFSVRVNAGYGEPYRDVVYELHRIEDNEHGRQYAVVVGGLRIGTIFRRPATFERKPRKSRVVTCRWSSLRWFGQSEADPTARLYQFDCETRPLAAKGVVEAWVRSEGRP